MVLLILVVMNIRMELKLKQIIWKKQERENEKRKRIVLMGMRFYILPKRMEHVNRKRIELKLKISFLSFIFHISKFCSWVFLKMRNFVIDKLVKTLLDNFCFLIFRILAPEMVNSDFLFPIYRVLLSSLIHILQRIKLLFRKKMGTKCEMEDKILCHGRHFYEEKITKNACKFHCQQFVDWMHFLWQKCTPNRFWKKKSAKIPSISIIYCFSLLLHNIKVRKPSCNTHHHS